MNEDQPGIAIVGMSGRFPGAADVAGFWRNLCDGVESITHFAPDELHDAFTPAVRAQPNFVAARSVLDDADRFDAAFFEMHAREAALTDPQHRVLLECAWEALEDAGYDPGATAQRIGVIAGCSIGSYFLRNVLGDRPAIEAFTSAYGVDGYPQLLGAGHDFLATRIAYKLNLRGPAFTVQTACSTSLTAVAQACAALTAGQADLMLAGAVSITFPQERGYLHQPGGMASSDGHCRTFDARASGTVFGSGAGVVALKRLADALADGDTIYAVIRGYGINNDGGTKAGYTAPSATGQAAAIEAAYAMAGFAPATIGYVECHGTATPLGDPIEFAALARVFGARAERPTCVLGSVKSNVGHLDIAAGMSGLVKTALALQTGKLPATLHYEQPNPNIPIDGSPFVVTAALRDWELPAPQRRAGVSAFGVGGTNVHLALEGPPGRAPRPLSDVPQLFVVSARSAAALDRGCERLAAHLRAQPQTIAADAAFTLQTGRRAFAFRRAIVARTAIEAAERLETALGSEPVDAAAPPVALLFAGQGVQYEQMGRGAYERFPVFAAAVDRCARILEPRLGCDLRDAIFNAGSAVNLTRTALAQPAIFTIEYALAQLWSDWGIAPVAYAGHSVGEFVAATLAGVFALEDALAIVAERGRLMDALPPGAMLAVRLGSDELEALLDSPLGLAAANSPVMSVAAGPFDAIAALEARLTARGVAHKRLATSHAFHSPPMDAIVEPLGTFISAFTLRAPQVPYVSSVTGDWITDAEATSPAYWARHCRDTVRFERALVTLCATGATLLEAAPGSVLQTFARQGAGKATGATILGSLPGPGRERSDDEQLLTTLGALWTAGAPVRWAALHAPPPRRIPLPTYPFERSRHWIETPGAPPAAASEPPPPAADATTLSPATPTEKLLVNTTVPQPAAGELDRRARVQRDLVLLLEELSGETISAADCGLSFLELGLDSLFLGRFVGKIAAQLGVELTFRQLVSDVPSVNALAARIDAMLPPDTAPMPAANAPNESAASAASEAATPSASDARTASISTSPRANGAAPAVNAMTFANVTGASPSGAANANASAFENVVREQLAAMQALLRDQLQAFGHIGGASATTGEPAAPAAATAPPPSSAPAAATAPQSSAPAAPSEPPSRFEVFRPGSSGARAELTPAQRSHIEGLVARTVARTPRSKALTQQHRAQLADPRVAAGFRSEWKEMVYPLACDRAKGSKLWDIDGNRYIDLLNGFGQTAFGHSPDFVVSAVEAQLKRGFPIGPQTSLAGDVAELFCELTGNERVTFCNTGSEAVMAAIRLARTVTGRDKVAIFNGAYHGQFDEVLVRGGRTSPRALPVAPGIPNASVSNMIVLPYADNASLAWVREHAAELAAVIVEPVQSRHPDLQPKDFLTEIRAITAASGSAFVFDEVVTGFRMHPGGMQHVFGIRADMATYGKVVGGGMPVGILAGTARFMDALDGGMWQYGDDSVPEVPPTFFAGTFVRHPLVMAAVLAVLKHLKAQGPALQEALSERCAGLVARINADLERRAIGTRIETFGSLFYVNFAAEERLAGLLYYHLRLRGVYIQEGFPCFLTTAHSPSDIETIVTAFSESFDELQAVGIFGNAPPALASGPAASIPLTEEQTEIWLAAQLGDPASCAFNESFTLRLEGVLDEAAFAQAWDALLARHDALRARFAPTGESLRIEEPARLEYVTTDLSALSAAEAERELAATVAADAATPFDLVAGPPVRAHLLRLGAGSHAWIFTAHHIVCDGWSINVLLTEFRELYAAVVAGRDAALEPALAFADYARGTAHADPAKRAATEAFWLRAFSDPVAPLDLPGDRPRPAVKSFAGATRSLLVDAERARALKRAGAQNGGTLFVTLLAAFDALIGKLAGTSDVVVGVPAAGQTLLENANLVGHCVDFLPVRGRWDAQRTTLGELIRTLRTTVLDAYEHQDYTLGTLVRKLNLPRATNRLPLAEIQFNLDRVAGDLSTPELTIALVPNPKAFVNFDLFLNVIESDAGLRLDCDYATDLFDAATIDRWLHAYVTLLDAFATDAGVRVADVALAAPAPAQALSICADTARDYPADTTFIALFEQQAHARPEAIAALCGTERISYAALDRRANALARHLQARVACDGARIGIAVTRSIDLLVALLATHKAGYAYVPLDPAHPPARLRHILGDARIAALVTDASAEIETPPGTPAIHLQLDRDAFAVDASAPPRSAGPDDLAYAIYTSGSTGTPKGVEITHRALVNFLCAMAHEPGFGPTDTLLAVTTVAFDIAALELFVPLVTGGTVAIASSEETRDGALLGRRLATVHATALQATPATWRLLLEAGFRAPAGFRMLCGGEALPRDLADRLLAGEGELWNMYGPTETTVWSACARVAPSGPVVVGRPIANTQCYILDADDRIVPLGVTGQLHIGGAGVARGYHARDELTAEKFIANPFGPGRLYRTGDFARMHAGGSIEVLGRGDDQIKLRGFRIEPGEIENVLTQHAELDAAAVALRDDAAGRPRLVAYFVERSGERAGAPITPQMLRSVAAEYLPDYMVPATWVRLPELPLNANGKLDRAALPAPEPDESEAAFREPQTRAERSLAEIWAAVLGRDRIGLDDDIFALGADSIQIFAITARANRAGIPLLAKHLMTNRTLGATAAHIDGLAAMPVSPVHGPKRRSLAEAIATVTAAE